MTTNDIRQSPAARCLLLVRDTTATLRAAGWSVREAATYEGGMADAVAARIWRRKELTADVRLVVHCHDSDDHVLASSIHSEAEALPSFCFAETLRDDQPLGGNARIAPPPMRVHVAALRAEEQAFARQVDAAFWSTHAIIGDLHEHELEVYNSDALAYEATAMTPREPIPHVTLLHPMVVTAGAISILGDNDRFATKPSARVIRTRAASGEREWIDLVSAGALGAFVQSITRHYTSAFKKRRFT